MDLFQKNFELQCELNRLLHSSIQKVFYYELNYPERGYCEGIAHRVDFAVEFITNMGYTFHLAWNSDRSHFHPGVGLMEIGNHYNKDEMECWEVTTESYYQPYLNQPIASIQIFWDWIRSREGKKCYYPSDVEFVFESGQSMVLAVGELGKRFNGKQHLINTPGGDIYIIFGDLAAKKLMRGRYTVDSVCFPIHQESVA